LLTKEYINSKVSPFIKVRTADNRELGLKPRRARRCKRELPPFSHFVFIRGKGFSSVNILSQKTCLVYINHEENGKSASKVLVRAFCFKGVGMKSAVLKSMEDLCIEERPMPMCKEYDVIVAVKVCGVCRTERKAWAMGQKDLVLPRVLGHEIAGVVHQIGSKISKYYVGQHVAVSPGLFCGKCVYCVSGLDHLCVNMRILGFHVDGGYSQYMLVPGFGQEPYILNEIPDNLDFKTASLSEPLACAYNLISRLHVEQAQNIVILGGGPLGVLSALLSRYLSKANIIIVEPQQNRRQQAQAYSHYQFASYTDAWQKLMELSKGLGAEVVLPCCPDSTALSSAVNMAAKRGRVGFLSGLTGTLSLDNTVLNIIHYRELDLLGAYGCSLADTQKALQLLASGAVDVYGLQDLEVSWQEIEKTISNLEPSDHIFTYFIP